MRIHIKHKFEHPLEWVLKVTHYDLIKDTGNYTELPNVTDVKLTHFTEYPDGRQDIEFTYCAHGQIPPIAQKVLKPEMLTWREVSKWDPNTMVYSFEIIPFFLKKLFFCKGKWTYTEKRNKVVLEMKGQLNFKVPIVGPIIEKAIFKELVNNQAELYANHIKKLEALARAEREKDK